MINGSFDYIETTCARTCPDDHSHRHYEVACGWCGFVWTAEAQKLPARLLCKACGVTRPVFDSALVA